MPFFLCESLAQCWYIVCEFDTYTQEDLLSLPPYCIDSCEIMHISHNLIYLLHILRHKNKLWKESFSKIFDFVKITENKLSYAILVVVKSCTISNNPIIFLLNILRYKNWNYENYHTVQLIDFFENDRK